MKIRGEQKELAEEREELEKILKSQGAGSRSSSRARSRPTRRSTATTAARKIVEREAAQAIDETELVANEPVDRRAVEARLGARGQGPRDRSAHAVVQGRRRVPARGARAAARSRRCSSTDRARLQRWSRTRCPRRADRASRCRSRSIRRTARRSRGVLIGEPEDLWLVASDAGYGFIVQLKETAASKKAGKTVLECARGRARACRRRRCPAMTRWSRSRHEGGKLLVFPVKDLPELPRGKGNKMFDIPTKKFASREDFLTAMTVVRQGQVAGRALRRSQDDDRVGGSQGLPRPARAARLGVAARLAHGGRARDRVGGQGI